ncbi:uncharacterized protein B0T23DRAFT_426100 [Neurospora hispaniola]|uniref:Uncharacterized protein n=1 Tax=Neurospora hispaniola TaxID=588809 RepID=A0AAJ0MTE5_9PEZI|nr:hypothetical protein NEUTE2DRAFT_50058 [Neurospora tetrasperma FGSC 2509]KAK3496927.1 hypothetical protein B0T23DRAFT_426100 [Neurospora hispaniola]
MSFPKLIPAFTAQIVIEPPANIGTTARGGTMLFVPFVPNSGSVKSEASYPIQLDAEFVHGADYVRMDPNGENVRLEIHSVGKDKTTGALFRFNYTGTVSLAGAAGKVFRGEPDMATTGFGDAFTHHVFETGNEKLFPLQNKVFVGSGRFIIEPGKPIVVEYKISEVTAS